LKPNKERRMRKMPRRKRQLKKLRKTLKIMARVLLRIFTQQLLKAHNGTLIGQERMSVLIQKLDSTTIRMKGVTISGSPPFSQTMMFMKSMN
jgi:hypothetical protein